MSNIGKRVRVVPSKSGRATSDEYYEKLEVNTGIIIKEDYVYDIILDNGLYVYPFKEWHPDCQVEFIDEFVVPKKWYIEGCNELKEYFKFTHNSSFDGSFYGFGYYLTIKNEWSCSNLISSLKDYTEITFEQFKKYILKENKMDKKTIGYIAPYDLFNGAVKKGDLYVRGLITEAGANAFYYVPERHQKHNKLTTSQMIAQEIVETWEPVYEEEFKVGDWIITRGGTVENPRKIRECCYIENNTFYWFQEGTTGKHEWPLNRIRKATPEEIEKSQKIYIGEYEVFNNVGYGVKNVVINRETYSIEELESLYNIMNKHNSQIKSLKVGCNGQYEVDLKLLEKIINRLEKQ